ncbi:radical SAM family heme chaperone HemW [Gammaproteobacteria bacterium]|nr:radical SAM family heme chaperone HemW [Gammaproteobacteria bacterium]
MANMNTLKETIPLSIYVHLPWCVKKCPYCDFNSHEAKNTIPEEAYIESLTKDLDQNLSTINNREIVSIFFGGGTPSLFSPKSIATILNILNNKLNLSKNTEITLEANPGTIDEKNFKGFKQAGVNRLSIGIQSLQDNKLKTLGRIHGRDSALNAINIAINSGFDNFNLDLMHGLPNQSVEDSLNDIKDALNFAPNHLSWYQLTIEPNTLFHHNPPKLPLENTLFNIQEAGKAELLKQNLNQYEVSAYSKQSYECAHNINYWEFGDYLGIGAGAHSKITDVDKQIITRHWQLKNPKDYMNPNKKNQPRQSILSTNDIIFEFMLNALRLTNGFSKSLFNERTGLSINIINDKLKQALHKKLLLENSERILTTELGKKFLNDSIGIFLP